MSAPSTKLMPLVEKLKAYLEEARREKGTFGIEPRLNMNLIGPDGWMELHPCVGGIGRNPSDRQHHGMRI